MCSLRQDETTGRIIQCEAHHDLMAVAKALSDSVTNLTSRVEELEKSVRTFRNAALLLAGMLVGTGVLQIKELLAFIGG